MSLLEAAVLGIVQGLTEFLPISSTAHLRAVPALLGWSDPGTAYSAVIQLGSVVAVLAYFAKDLIQIAVGFFDSIRKKDFGTTDARLGAAILLGTIPICVIGLILKDTLEADNSPLRSLFLIGAASIVMGILLWLAERFGKRQREIDQIGIKDGLIIGAAQALALIPGCSRSGSTLTAALLLSLKREDAARFSFLLGVPAIVLSGIVEAVHIYKGGIDATSGTSLGIGLVTSTVVSYAAIWWLLNFLKEHTTTVFIVYRLVFGIAIIALAAAGMVR